jgi:hypothetical protein
MQTSLASDKTRKPECRPHIRNTSARSKPRFQFQIFENRVVVNFMREKAASKGFVQVRLIAATAHPSIDFHTSGKDNVSDFCR